MVEYLLLWKPDSSECTASSAAAVDGAGNLSAGAGSSKAEYKCKHHIFLLGDYLDARLDARKHREQFVQGRREFYTNQSVFRNGALPLHKGLRAWSASSISVATCNCSGWHLTAGSSRDIRSWEQRPDDGPF
eukprot:185994-Pyramimonas_sp.AAC.1